MRWQSVAFHYIGGLKAVASYPYDEPGSCELHAPSCQIHLGFTGHPEWHRACSNPTYTAERFLCPLYPATSSRRCTMNVCRMSSSYAPCAPTTARSLLIVEEPVGSDSIEEGGSTPPSGIGLSPQRWIRSKKNRCFTSCPEAPRTQSPPSAAICAAGRAGRDGRDHALSRGQHLEEQLRQHHGSVSALLEGDPLSVAEPVDHEGGI